MHRLVVAVVCWLTACATWSPRAPLRVLVYNIHAGKDARGVENLERVAALIESSRADVVFLQEIDRRTTRSGNVDHFERLMTLTGMHGVFGKSLDYQGGEYGIAILSRTPIRDPEVVPLHVRPPQTRAGGSLEPRIALFATIGSMRVANTHLDASREDTWRKQEIAELLRAIAKNRPTLIGGDFNATPDSEVIATVRGAKLTDVWIDCGGGNELTYPAHAPFKRIDYLFVTNGARCRSARVLETEASDHRPLLVDVMVRD